MSGLPVTPSTESDDAREFDAFVRMQDPLDIEAATWVVRARNGLDAQGQADLQAWLDADPDHAAAYDEMDQTLGEVRQLTDSDVTAFSRALSEWRLARPALRLASEPVSADVLTDARARPQSASPPPPLPLPPRPPDVKRRQWLAGVTQWLPRLALASVIVALAGGGWFEWARWQQRPIFEQSYATTRGQFLQADLPDASAGQGTTVQVDTATQADVRLYRDRRELRLREGQVMLAVHADAARPFVVRAGGLKITVVGTRFSVRHNASGLHAGQTTVAVESGRVRVARDAQREPSTADPRGASGRRDDDESRSHPGADGAGERVVELTAGQTIVADASGHLGPVAAIGVGVVGAWREGRISFDQTPLQQAIAEFERYGRTGLVVRDPVVGAMPVGGSYSLRQIQRFVDSLPQVLPVRLERHADRTEIVAR